MRTRRLRAQAQAAVTQNCYVKKTKSIYNNLIKQKEVSENQLITAMDRYSDSVKDTETAFIVHPVTWLNQGRWEDKIEVKVKNKNWLAG